MEGDGIPVTIEYYAQLREQAGCQREQVNTRATTAAALYGELRERHGFDLEQSSLRAAVNDDFVDWQHRLSAGDRVVFIPPVAGG